STPIPHRWYRLRSASRPADTAGGGFQSKPWPWLRRCSKPRLNHNQLKSPNLIMGQPLMVADFGGQHKGEHYDTYAFLVLDLERNCNWLERQQLFRRTVMPNARRMSFKAM